jgi:hypothetical protein
LLHLLKRNNNRQSLVAADEGGDHVRVTSHSLRHWLTSVVDPRKDGLAILKNNQPGLTAIKERFLVGGEFGKHIGILQKGHPLLENLLVFEPLFSRRVIIRLDHVAIQRAACRWK